MPQAGHVLIGTEGQLLDVDAAFCDIMRSGPDDLRGRRVLDVTAPADRDDCARAMAALRDTQQPVSLVKRLIRNDGSLIWVRNSVAITVDGDRGPIVVATVEPIIVLASNDHPATLLTVARFLVAIRRERALVCDPMLFAEPGWDAVLAAYVAEAEGLVVDVARLAAMLDHAPLTIERWINALVQHGVLEIEHRSVPAQAPRAFRLTGDTHAKLEAYLSAILAEHRELVMSD